MPAVKDNMRLVERAIREAFGGPRQTLRLATTTHDVDEDFVAKAIAWIETAGCTLTTEAVPTHVAWSRAEPCLATLLEHPAMTGTSTADACFHLECAWFENAESESSDET